MRKQVMSSAWQLVKSAGLTLSEALKKAWKAVKLKSKLLSGIVEFSFTKKDGSIRKAKGTLRSDLFKYEPKGSNTKNYKSVAYYDLDANGFRSFSIGSLV